ncbi:MAG: heparinase II/III family protein [Verrucomicrobia bacterium]|nr:heparinase II/III family protein [Verrucomicrobiota bacterium]MCH8513907.1 heparinase II/III family protein [Kiritimatiellia bacterium]
MTNPIVRIPGPILRGTLLLLLLTGCAGRPPSVEESLPSVEALQPFRSSWMYSTVLNRRPGDGLTVNVNPPRFSWPYLREIVAEDIRNISPTVFTLEIADDTGFSDPKVRIEDTPYNFHNALAPLPPGTWYWRVGYGPQPDVAWSEVQSFVVTEETPVWDRTFITGSVERLGELTGSRTAPDGENWQEWNARLAGHSDTRMRHEMLFREAERVMALPWWDDFPETDQLGRPTRTREERTRWVTMLKNLSVVAYCYRLSGDEQYAGALPRIVQMAAWPKGGLLSPENLGGQTKMPSQAAELFAVVYDWFRDEWTPEDRDILKESIRWRLQDMFFAPNSIIWRDGDNMRHFGLAYAAGSHPYQNLTWAVPAIVLMVGELEIADTLLELSLNYLTGVTIPDGPEEGYNEGHGYSNEKAGTLLDAVLVVEMLMPEAEQGRNPVIQNLIDWFAYLFSGPEDLPWGDSWLGTSRNIGDENLRKLAMLTGSPLAKSLWQERGRGEYGSNVRSLYSRPWFEFMAWDRYAESLEALPEAEIDDTLFLPEAGWVFAHSRPILTLDDYKQAVGMQFQMRPMGGYGHSFASDGSFVWFAHGALLSVGGGWRSWASLGYSRSPLSHNSLLVNGVGHTVVDPYQPQRPWAARPLAFERGENFTYWAADLSEGYRPQIEVDHVVRHVLFVEGRWFVIFDDLQATEPAHFTWLFHVQQDVPMQVEDDGFQYTVSEVNAEVRFANAPGTLEIQHAIGQEAYVNPDTGEDFYPVDMERARSREEFRSFLTRPLNKHSLRVRNVEPTASFQFLSVLNASPDGTDLPEIEVIDEKRVALHSPDGRRIVVSFDPSAPGDFTIDPQKPLQGNTP